jgi:hypothetical protein
LSTWALPAILLVGLFVDELPIAAFFVIPAVFWPSFLPIWPSTRRWGSRLAAWVQTGLLLALPLAVFLFLVLVVGTAIISRAYGFQFDYFGDTLRTTSTRQPGASILDGKVPFSFALMLENSTNLLGLSLSPWFLSPLVQSPVGEFPGSQVSNLAQVALILAFLGACAFVIARTRTMLRWHLLGLLLALPPFFFFLTVVMVHHIPIVTGYYYGAGFASLLAVLVGLLVGGIGIGAPSLRPLAGLAVLWIVAVQSINFAPINAGWIWVHNSQVTQYQLARQRPEVQRCVRITGPGELTRTELDAIWSAWQAGQLDSYVRRAGVTGAAAYEVFELRALDDVRLHRSRTSGPACSDDGRR